MDFDGNQFSSCKRLKLAVGLSFVLMLLFQGSVVAQQEDVADSAAEELEELRPLLELGVFNVQDLRQTRNETIKLTFRMYLALNKSAGKQTVEQLEHWKHRLRNQVLIAIRLAERQDFLEPGLHRFRQIVKLRINRLIKNHLVDESLLTEFTMTTTS